MSTYHALFLKEKFGALELGTKTLPTPGPGEILIKEIAVGLNPVDWRIQDYSLYAYHYPTILGCEGAGEVEGVGEGVTQFKKGDKVFHQGTAANDQYGTFQEYVLVPAEIVVRIPANITFDQAAALPVCVGTVAIPFYSPSPVGAGLKAPWEGGRGQCVRQTALILGGASSVGQIAIQFARLSGFSKIIATASLRNTDLLKSLGATHVIDRNIPPSSFASAIAKITVKPIPLIFDAIAIPDTQQEGYDILAEMGHILVVHKSEIRQIAGTSKQVLDVIGSVQEPANRAIGRALAQHLPALLEAGDIVPNQVEVIPGGLNGIIPGLDRLRNRSVSAKKLIVHPGETA
ncbi:chaperonin 10-like protein [Butyriboletus roseoflavus]|nr:chaperonin 10-like protein [Butyriboletus roseoflavus]